MLPMLSLLQKLVMCSVASLLGILCSVDTLYFFIFVLDSFICMLAMFWPLCNVMLKCYIVYISFVMKQNDVFNMVR